MYARRDAIRDRDNFYFSKLVFIVEFFEKTIEKYAKKGRTSCKIVFTYMNFTEDEVKYLLNEMKYERQFCTTHRIKDKKHIFEFEWL